MSEECSAIHAVKSLNVNECACAARDFYRIITASDDSKSSLAGPIGGNNTHRVARF